MKAWRLQRPVLVEFLNQNLVVFEFDPKKEVKRVYESGRRSFKGIFWLWNGGIPCWDV